MDINTQTLKALRRATKGRASITEGTVVRWVSGDVYQYAAIYAAGYWWLTGAADFYGDRRLTHQEFTTRVLQNAGTTTIGVATEWEDLP